MADFGKALTPTSTPIPGLIVFDLPVHGDARGWFKENWQREKQLALGLPDFGPVQNNISFNAAPGVTRGIHAEPWDKYITVAHGRVFAAVLDLRPLPSYGRVVSLELDPGNAVLVPRGCGNSYQTLTPDVVYTYLVNEHWSPEASYTFVQAYDPALAIAWPIAERDAIRSDKDRAHPPLAELGR